MATDQEFWFLEIDGKQVLMRGNFAAMRHEAQSLIEDAQAMTLLKQFQLEVVYPNGRDK